MSEYKSPMSLMFLRSAGSVMIELEYCIGLQIPQ